MSKKPAKKAKKAPKSKTTRTPPPDANQRASSMFDEIASRTESVTRR